MKLRAVGCIVVTVLIVGMYILLAYGDDLGIVHPINRTFVHQTIDPNLTRSPFNGTIAQGYDHLPNGEVVKVTSSDGV